VQVISPTQRPLPDNTQHSQEKDIHAPSGIRTCNPIRERAQTNVLDGEANGIGGGGSNIFSTLEQFLFMGGATELKTGE
jgi:hypothetical protein